MSDYMAQASYDVFNLQELADPNA